MRCVFIDRDGVLNQERSDYVRRVEDFSFLPGATVALAALAATPFGVAVVTNQSAVGRGYLTPVGLAEIHEHMLSAVRAARGRIDAIYVCPHRPEDGCACRKPKAGLLLRAAEELGVDLAGSYLIGDAASDVEAALAVGCRSVLVLTGRGPAARRALAERGVHAYDVAPDLGAAVEHILNDHRRG
jgi:D-glycero-D-manno-heptose 1,7-bisphosphate phosphatase